MFRRRLIISIIIMVLVSLMICGAAFRSPEVVLDPAKHIVYQGIKADNLIVYFQGNTKAAKELYEDKYFAVYGKIGEISKNQKEVSLLGTTISGDGKIICDTSSDNVKMTVGSFNLGDTVKVYGKLDTTLFQNQVIIKVDRIESVKISVGSTTEYNLINNISVDTEYLMERKLHKGKIKYYIPPEWTKVENNISETGTGSIEGYQYKLNGLNDVAYPESFFVCYFDNSLLASPNDKDKAELIEKAIIANILKQDPAKLNEKFPLKKTDSYYGAKYIYYQDKYNSDTDGYRVEFVFQQDGNEGFVVYLYVYKNADHVDDIMITMRLLEM